MRIRINIGLLAAVLFGVVLWFASSEITWAANATVQQSCTLKYPNGNPYPNSTSPMIVTAQPPVSVPGVGTQWQFLVNTPPTGTNQFVLLAPACFPDSGYTVQSGGQVLGPGVGDSTTNFGLGDFQEYVIRLAISSAQPSLYSFYTTLTPMSTMNESGQFKIGKDIAYCQDIAVPSCVDSVSVISSQVTTSNGVTFCKQRGDVYDVGVNGDCNPPGALLPYKNQSDLHLEGYSLTIAQEPGSHGVQDIILQDSGPGTTYYCIAGKCYYK